MKSGILIIVLLSGQISAAACGVMPWNQPTSPAEIALSGAVLELTSEPQGLSLNPALLAGVKWKGISSSGVLWPMDIYGGSVIGVFSVARAGTAAAGISYWNYGQLDAYDRLGRQLGTIEPYAVSVMLGFGRRLYGGLSGGISLKGAASTIGNNKDYCWCSDLAVSYNFRHLTANVQLRDLGPRYPVNDSLKYDMVKTVTAGVNKTFFNDRLAAGLQLNAAENQKWHPLLGLEYSPIKAVTIRLGYDGDGNKPERSKLGLGVCFKQTGKQDYSVEYGYRSWGTLGTAQALSLGMSF
jgi:hypothetical protein